MNRKFLAIILLTGFIFLNFSLSYAQETQKITVLECPAGFKAAYSEKTVTELKWSGILGFAIPGGAFFFPPVGSRVEKNPEACIRQVSGRNDCVAAKGEQPSIQKDGSWICYGAPTNIKRSGDIPIGKVSGEVKGYTTQVKIPCDPKITGACPSLATPAGYIARIYIFGLMIAGLAAFGGIIYGSLKYILSAGNIGSQQDAKDQITNAVLGLVLLLGAYIVLYTINPDLVNLRNPQLEVINLANLRPEEETGGEQRLIANGGGDDPLCKLAVNAGITVGLTGTARTGQEVGQIGQDISGAVGEFFGSGGEKKGSYCFKCADGATKNDGVCRCIAPFVEYGGGCVLKESIPKTVE